MKFRKKPVVIDAIEWMGFNIQAVCDFVVGVNRPAVNNRLLDIIRS